MQLAAVWTDALHALKPFYVASKESPSFVVLLPLKSREGFLH